MKDRPSGKMENLACAVTRDPNWQHGFIERWENGVKLPLLREAGDAQDPVAVLRQWFARARGLTVLGRGPSAKDAWTAQHRGPAVIVVDPTYATRDVYEDDPLAVLIGDDSPNLAEVAARFLATTKERRPLLMHAYLPRAPRLPFADYGLPRPVPILPLLVRAGVYEHEPFAPYPTSGVFAVLLAAALSKPVVVAGIDLYQHPSGKAYTNDQPFLGLPAQHSQACDRAHLLSVLHRLGDQAAVHPFLRELLGGDADPAVCRFQSGRGSPVNCGPPAAAAAPIRPQSERAQSTPPSRRPGI